MGKPHTGCLYKQKNGKAYTLLYYVNGKRMRIALHDEEGKPITTKAEARARASVILAPLLARKAADRATLTAQAAEAAEATAARMSARVAETEERQKEEKAARQTLLENCWSLYANSRKRAKCLGDLEAGQVPKRGTNAHNYYLYWGVFMRFVKSRHEDGAEICLCNLTADDINAFCDSLKRRKSAGTYNKYVRFLRHFCEVVCNEARVGCHDLFADVDYTANRRVNSRKVLTPEQVKALFETATGETRLLCMIGFYTGLRLGDAATLNWSEVDLGRRIISRVPSKTAKSSGAAVKVGIPLPLCDALAAAKEAAQDSSGHVLPDLARRYTLNRGLVSVVVRRLFEACGLANRNGFTEYGFHSFRHTYVTMQAEAGTPLAILQRIVGHSSPMMTEHYVSGLSDGAAIRFADSVYSPSKDGARERVLSRIAAMTDSQLETLEHLLDTNAL